MPASFHNAHGSTRSAIDQNDLVLHMDGVSAFGAFDSSAAINMANLFDAKTLGIAFTAGDDVESRQVIYEQGGGWRGFNMYIEGGQLHMNVWSIAGDTVWGYRTVSVDIEPGEDYSAVMTISGAADGSGVLAGYLDGESIGEIGGVGLLRAHNNGNGVGESNGHSVFAGGEVDGAANTFGGAIHEVVQYNRTLDPAEAEALNAAITPEPAPEPAPGEPIVAPAGAVLSLDDPAYGDIKSEKDLNLGRNYEEKTVGITFTAGENVDDLQVLYEQGGGWRGLSLYIEGGQLHMNVWSINGGTVWGFKSVAVDIEPGESYTAAMVMEGAKPANGVLTGYLNGEAVGAVDGVGLLLRHPNGIGIGAVNGQTVVDGAVHAGESPFGGVIERLVQYNSALEDYAFDDLNAWLADALPQPAPEPDPGEAPVIAINTGADLAEGGEATLTPDMLNAEDPDTADGALTYTITDSAAHGGLYRDGVLLEVGDSFTQAELNDGLIAYTHNGSETLADGFAFTLSDGETTLAEQRFDVAIDPVNDAPVITANTGAALAEGGAAMLTPAMLGAADVDNDASDLTYTITDAADHGALVRDGVALRIGDSFTQAELNSGLIAYTHDGSETLADGFAFTLSDGEATLAEQRFDVSIDPVNDAPIITGGTTFSIAEDAATGATIGQLLAADAEGDALVFDIIGGNADGLFAIDAQTGEISLAGGLDYETQTGHSLEVAVSDGAATTRAIVDIDVTDVDETPGGMVGKQNIVVVIDAGDRAQSPDYFTVADDYDIRMNDSDANGPHTHGKAVEKSIYDIVGPDTDTEVVHLKIASDSSTGASSWTMGRAFDYVIDNLMDAYDVLSVNLSYGAGATDSATTYFDSQFEILKENGTIVTIAAGNDGSSGTNVIANSVHENVFVMSASSTSGRHEGYSNEGLFTDYYAKGTTWWHRDADNTESDSGIRGTSFAAPTATGLVAKVQETAEDMFGRLLDVSEITTIFDNVTDTVVGRFTGDEKSLLNFDGVMKSFSDFFSTTVTLDESGDTSLLYKGGQYQIETASGALLDITRGGSVFTDDMNAGWDPYQVEDNELGGFTLVFRSEFGTESYRQWELDETGGFLSADNGLNEAEKKTAEKTLGVDLNNDLKIETDSGQVSVFAGRDAAEAPGAAGSGEAEETDAFILASDRTDDVFDFGAAAPAVLGGEEQLDLELSFVQKPEVEPVDSSGSYDIAPMPGIADLGGFVALPEAEELWLI